jgi:hypothetical protein
MPNNLMMVLVPKYVVEFHDLKMFLWARFQLMYLGGENLFNEKDKTKEQIKGF